MGAGWRPKGEQAPGMRMAEIHTPVSVMVCPSSSPCFLPCYAPGILIMVLRAWSRRSLLLAVNPSAARDYMLAGTKDGTHQAAVVVAGGVASANNGHIRRSEAD